MVKNNGTIHATFGKWFDGEDFDMERDGERLSRLRDQIWRLMYDQRWRTLEQVSNATRGSEASCSSKLRDFRKPKYGSHYLNKEYIGNGLWKYQVQPNHDEVHSDA